jgi:hypothetical protein
MRVGRGNLTDVKNGTAFPQGLVAPRIKTRIGGKFLFSGGWHKGFIDLSVL